MCAQAFPQAAGSADSEREKDVYAIYSLMLTNPRTSHGADDNERYLIAVTTAPARPLEPCVDPPRDREGEYREVLVDYDRRKSTSPRELKPAFSIRKSYLLLSADDISEFRKERSLPNASQTRTDQRFRGVTDVFTLSDVYFNQRGTLALTAISSWCGSLCGLYQWKVFERQDTGKWEERHWSTCVVISENVSRGATRQAARYSSR